MERDALISHGVSEVLRERLCVSSDLYKPVFCERCGTIAISDVINKQLMCKTCKEHATFGVCPIPYAFKLLTNMLVGAGLKMTLGFAKVETQK